MTRRKRFHTEGSDASDHYKSINERPVDDISLEFFYQPHTITTMLVTVIALTYTAFARDEMADWHSNVSTGLVGVVVIFMILSVITLPNGPFIRPHPALWRCVLGLSILYLLMLQFLVHQDYATIRTAILWIDPGMANYTIDSEKEYGVNCMDITAERLWNSLDWFAFGHYWGWGMKALIIRHYGICWTISIMWELTEMVFGHLLPNFYECWWDNLVLDVLVCNGLGIFTGMQVCKFLTMREYKWESVKNKTTIGGKFKRALMQFTPESWTHTRWLDPASSYMRLIAVSLFMCIWQVVELNAFFMKHIFPLPAEHPICVMRILTIGLMAAPSTRQFYTYITDTQCKRLGTQCWVFIMITASELILSIKFGRELFSHTQLGMLVVWLVLLVVVSCLGLLASTQLWRWRRQARAALPEEEIEEEEKVKTFLASADNKIKQRVKRKARLD